MGFINPGRNLHSRTAGKRKQPAAATTTTTTTTTTTKRPRPRPRTRPSAPTPPRTRPLSPLEALPPELLYRIFEATHHAPSLPAASPHLAHTLNTPHLHLLHLRAHAHAPPTSPHALTPVLRRRLFTPQLLHLYESRFGPLSAAGAALPLRLAAPPWAADRLALFSALVRRGAAVAADDSEEGTWLLMRALVAGRGDVARVLLGAEGVRGDGECLRVVVERWGDEGLDVARVLVERGAEMGGVGVWRAALALGERGAGVVAWLLEGAAPPGEVLGVLSCR
ncbi:hypothetical protein DFP73DRAFT_523532 [Morchella snyderi]|nr:hypothetical protein DFP73DRAFT_523532 [Morchella snyderi]